MLGARALAEGASAWEHALRSNEHELLDDFAVAVAREIARLHVSAEALLQAPSLPAPPVDPALELIAREQTPANVDLDELRALLKRQNFKALEVFATIAPALQQEIGEARFEALRAAIDGLQYKQALQLLEALQSARSISLTVSAAKQ